MPHDYSKTPEAPSASLTASTASSRRVGPSRRAQEGLSNPEIGAQLFISPRTVQYHLRKSS